MLDFGLVKFSNRGPGETLMTLDHTTTGTPAYMAPEIILGETNVDRRADVYALGCVAYYLLTGQLVFEADTAMKMMLQHVQAEPVPPSQRTELPIPRELDEMVLACLQKDPDKRPQNADELFQIMESSGVRGWNHRTAKGWWELHLPDMTGPLIVGETGVRRGDARRRIEIVECKAEQESHVATHSSRARCRRKLWLDRALSLFTDVTPARSQRAAARGQRVLAARVLLHPQDGPGVADPERGRRRGESYASAGQAVLLLLVIPAYGAIAARVNRVRLISLVVALLCVAPRHLLSARDGRRPHRRRLLPLDRHLQSRHRRAVLGVRQRRLQQRARQAAVPAGRPRRLARRVARRGAGDRAVHQARSVSTAAALGGRSVTVRVPDSGGSTDANVPGTPAVKTDAPIGRARADFSWSSPAATCS